MNHNKNLPTAQEMSMINVLWASVRQLLSAHGGSALSTPSSPTWRVGSLATTPHNLQTQNKIPHIQFGWGGGSMCRCFILHVIMVMGIA
jgi:hypothetical protein